MNTTTPTAPSPLESRTAFERRLVHRLLAVLALAALVACGGSEPEPPKSASWLPGDAVPGAGSDDEVGDDAVGLVESTSADDPSLRDDGINDPPRIHGVTFDPEKPVVGDTVRVKVDATDPDGNTPFVSYEWTLSGRPVGASVPKLSLGGARKGDRVELTVTASDGEELSDVEIAWFTIANAPPTLRKVEVEPGAEISAGQKITLRPEARDRDGDAVEFRYRWTVNGNRVPENGATFDTAELERGDEVVAVVIATDGEMDSEPLETPPFRLTNTPPTITSWPGAPGADGVFQYQVVAEDPDGSNLMYRLDEAPEGMTIGSKTGQVRWEPGSGQLGTYQVAIVVDDLEGGQTKQVFELSTAAPDSPPAAPASP